MINQQIKMVEDALGGMFMLNYHNQPLRSKVTFQGHALPEDNGQFYLPPFSGLMLPFNLVLSDDYTLVNTTSEIAKIETTACGINIGVCGNENTPGQIYLDTAKIIKNVSLNDKAIPFEQSSQKVKIYYAHSKTADPITIKIS